MLEVASSNDATSIIKDQYSIMCEESRSLNGESRREVLYSFQATCSASITFGLLSWYCPQRLGRAIPGTQHSATY
jgi:hypothetical protein